MDISLAGLVVSSLSTVLTVVIIPLIRAVDGNVTKRLDGLSADVNELSSKVDSVRGRCTRLEATCEVTHRRNHSSMLCDPEE